ncbi:MAG: hypothetical protein M1825_005292 [Sarcosagium campestre]|nr:MAG: hypothetical protein M1825_005292 [Sarcosagium campestre]
MTTSKDDLKWFGEGFDGFPKRLPDDTVQYALYVIDEKLLTDAEVRGRLDVIYAAAVNLRDDLLKDFIWQREDFNLKFKQQDGISHLSGKTNYGDSVEDEWLIVYLLRQLTRQFADLWVQVTDADGEFLLVEAANALPSWLNPEVAQNRVWLHDGKLLIIPRATKDSNATRQVVKPLSLQDALSNLRSNAAGLIHSPTVESEAFYRLRDYPGHIAKNIHRAWVTIPRKLSFIINARVNLISPAAEAFYLRDPISLRPLHSFEDDGKSSLLFPVQDLVTVIVTFTRVIYAQLKSQQFPAPGAWAQLLSDIKDPVEMRRAELGMKVTCGFELLAADPQNRETTSVKQIQQLCKAIAMNKVQLPTDVDLAQWPRIEDDEKWLDIDFSDFERELAGNGGGGGAGGLDSDGSGDNATGGFNDKAAQENLRKMVSRFEEFLNDDTAGADGAEIRDEMDVDNDDDSDHLDDDDDDDDDDDSIEGEDKDVSFDEAEFARMMREMMGLPPDDDSLGDDSQMKTQGSKIVTINKKQSHEDDEGDDSDKDKGIDDIISSMEAELLASGALNLDPTPSKLAALKGKRKQRQATTTKAEESRHLGKHGEDDEVEDEDEDSDEEVNIDVNLARNILESFKGQGGMPGPGGNLMAALGIQIPRDESSGSQ